MISALKRLLGAFDIGITSGRRLRALQEQSLPRDTLRLLAHVSDERVVELVRSLGDSKSQLCQDVFVLAELDLKRNGYFVEFGATNGVDLSNTYLLEKRYQWRGILAEPGRRWHSALNANRDCHIETKCVWRESNRSITFNETNLGELSTIDKLSGGDFHSRARKSGTKYMVETLSLLDLLKKYDAPRVVDYLSIDTEGSEFEILNAFDFDKHQFRVITCEHNYLPDREKIFSLLQNHGYIRKFGHLSQFDDWYVFKQ